MRLDPGPQHHREGSEGPEVSEGWKGFEGRHGFQGSQVRQGSEARQRLKFRYRLNFRSSPLWAYVLLGCLVRYNSRTGLRRITMENRSGQLR